MPLIIDTYNVLHVTGVLPGELAVGSPEELARLIERSRFEREAVWLMCDGVPRGAARVGRIVIEGSGPGRTADEHIADFLARSTAPRRITVVTSDRAIVRSARARGAEVIASDAFLAMLADDARRKSSSRTKTTAAADPRRSVPLGEREITGWMRLFEITAEQAAIESSAPLGTPRKEASPRVHSASSDAALEQYLEATKGLADPLSILDGRSGADLLSSLGAIDDAALEAMMKAHEPPVLKDGARIGGRKRVRDTRNKRRSSDS